jgi:hypothetical protein
MMAMAIRGCDGRCADDDRGRDTPAACEDLTFEDPTFEDPAFDFFIRLNIPRSSGDGYFARAGLQFRNPAEAVQPKTHPSSQENNPCPNM